MISWFIQKKKFTILFFIMLFFLGLLSFLQLPQREIPETNPPVAQVTTIYPGASSEQVEKYVTNRIEDELQSVQEIKTVTSVSSPGISNITIELMQGEDTDQVWNLIQQKISTAQNLFPDGVENSNFNSDLSIQGLSTYQITIPGLEDLVQVESVLSRYEQAFKQIPEISEVSVQGVLDSEIRIELNREEMRSYQVTPTQVIRAINSEQNLIPPGRWGVDGHDYRLQYQSYSDVQNLANLPIAKTNVGEDILLGQVASVFITNKPIQERIRFQEELSVSVTFYLAKGASVPRAQQELNKVMAQVINDLPTNATLTLVYTQADLVKELFTQLGFAFLLAVISVLLVCSIGLNLSTSLSVALAIPVSLSIGSILLPYVGVDLNQISLIAFIISLGILVDDAIVVNENIERHLQMGKSSSEASIKGVTQVALSVITSSLTVIFTFLPLLLLPGEAGNFIGPLPTVVILTIVASTAVALILIPIYRVISDRKTKVEERKPAGILGRQIDQLANYYRNQVLSRVIKRPFLVTILGFIIGTLAYGLIPFIPLEFFPDTDREEIFISAKLPEGTLLSETELAAGTIEQWLLEQDVVRNVSTFIGTPIPRLFGAQSIGGASPNYSNFLVYIDKEQTSTREIMNLWNAEMSYAFPSHAITISMIESGPPVGAPIAIRVVGEDFTTLMEMANEVKGILANAEGVASVDDDAGRKLASLSFEPNRDAMRDWGITSDELTQTLRLVGEGIPLGQFEAESSLVDMRMVYEGSEKVSTNVVNEVFLVAQNGEQAPLAALVDMEMAFTSQNIPHRNLARTITVRAYPGERSTDEILAETREDLLALTEGMPGYSIEIAGEASARTDVFIDIGKIFIVVIFLILIVIGIQFYSLTIPVLVMSTVYLAIAGALLGLFITQTGLGFMSMMGAVSLAGIVVRNGIVLIEFFEQRRIEGVSIEEAVLEAGQARFRPILLTTLTTLGGLLPIALGSNTLFKPLGIAIVSGIIFSSLLTLVIVPALYMLQARWKEKRQNKFKFVE